MLLQIWPRIDCVVGEGDSPASGRAKLAASALCAERELGQANRLPHPAPAWNTRPIPDSYSRQTATRPPLYGHDNSGGAGLRTRIQPTPNCFARRSKSAAWKWSQPVVADRKSTRL